MNELMTTKMKKVKNKKGFTLIELIVVIAILGILAAIAIPRLGGFQKSAREKAADATASTIHKSIAIWQADNPTAAAPTPADQDEAHEDLTALIDLSGGSWTATYVDGSVAKVVYTGADGTLGYFPASDRPVTP